MIRKEWMLTLGVITVTLVSSIALIRWLAPGLLGGPADLQLIQLDEKVPAYYRGVFQEEHFGNGEFLLKDPLTGVRARPFFPAFKNLGPNDILGFRNTVVPTVADIVTIGDSMTYGNNAVMDQNWPSVMRRNLHRDDINVYNMSTGGWAAVQYLDMFTNAAAFKPRVVVVAFYTGNDPMESFVMVYGNEHWQDLIPDSTLSKSDAPTVSLDMPESETWDVQFRDGVHTVFTPLLRMTSNNDLPAVHAGYDIMSAVARRMGNQARLQGIQLVFTIIPTKELAYAEKVAGESIALRDDYALLIDKEKKNLANLAAVLSAIPEVVYVDVLGPLQEAAMGPVALYPEDKNGHPVAAGYEVIGHAIANSVEQFMPSSPKGLYALVDGNEFQIVLINEEGVWYFDNIDDIEANGWLPGELPEIEKRDLTMLPHNGIITTVNKARFGPK